MVRVCVEGNIACGKSTALQHLGRLRPQAGGGPTLFPEPVEEWGELLARFYADPAQWALAFSLRVLLSFEGPAAVPPAACAVVERSPVSCRHVFSQLLFNEGRMSQEEWDLFKDACDALAWTPDVMIYVQTPADECHRRMERRGRPEEAGVDLQYLKRLEFQYETMLRYATFPVVRVDGTRPPEEIAQAILDIAGKAAAGAAAGESGGGVTGPPRPAAS